MSSGRPSVVSRPPASDLVFLAVAIGFISTSGPLIAATAAPALAIAFWRCALGAGATGLWVMVRERRVLASLGRVVWRQSLLAGLLLGLHFAVWIPSLRFTSVASSTALVATQPVWAALIGRARGAYVPARTWIGIGVALAGVLVLAGVDFSLDPRALIGDGLALVGAVTAAAYVSIGERARKSVTTATYTLVLYGAAGVLLLVICLAGGQALAGYSALDWAYILALTAGAQLLGHTLINRVLITTSATVTSMAILFEMPGSTLIAALWLGQIPPVAIVPAMALLMAGLVLVIRSADPSTPSESPPV